jgi:hypothetical protein
MGDQVGQLGESGKYWMGRLRVVWCQIRSSKVVAPACVNWGPIVWPRWTRLSCVLTHTGFVGSRKLSASTVAELDDTPLYFTDDIGIVFGPPTDYPVRFSRGRWHLGMMGPAWLFDSQCKRWPLVMPVWFTCVVLLGYFPCKVIVDSNLRDTLGYGWSLFAAVIP